MSNWPTGTCDALNFQSVKSLKENVRVARNRRTYVYHENLHDAEIDLKPAHLALDLLACIWNWWSSGSYIPPYMPSLEPRERHHDYSFTAVTHWHSSFDTYGKTPASSVAIPLQLRAHPRSLSRHDVEINYFVAAMWLKKKKKKKEKKTKINDYTYLFS